MWAQTAQMRVVLACAFLIAASAARADLVGIYVDGGPGFAAVTPDGGHPATTYLPLVPRFGMWIENTNYFLDVDMSLLMGSAIDLLDTGGPIEHLVFPTAREDPAVRLQVGRMFRFTSGAYGWDLAKGLRLGVGFDVDIASQQAVSTRYAVGNTFIGLGLGPSMAWAPLPALRTFASLWVGGHIGNHPGFVSGWQLTSQVTVSYAVLPRYLDLRATVLAEHRSFLDGIYPDAIGGGFSTVVGTIGIVGHLGWIFGIDEDEARWLAPPQPSS